MAKPLVIVESPAKARTLARLLGDEYRVEASIGHIRDLPENASEVPAEIKDKPWGSMAIDVDNGFRPYYVIARDKAGRIRDLRSAVKDAPEVLLATDPDREGESISWHLREVLKPQVPIRRIVFHEITEEAIRRGDRRLARHRPEAGRRSGEPSDRGPAVRIHGLPGAVEEGPDRSQRRSRAERGRPPRRRARGGAQRVPQQRLLGSRGSPSDAGGDVRGTARPHRRRPGGQRPRLRPRWATEDRWRATPRRGLRPRSGRCSARSASVASDRGRGTAGNPAAVATLHDVDAPAGGEPQARVLRRPHDERGPAPLYRGTDLVPPYRLDHAERAGSRRRHPARFAISTEASTTEGRASTAPR